MKINQLIFFVLLFIFGACTAPNANSTMSKIQSDSTVNPKIVVGAERVEDYINLLMNKRVGLVVNQTSRIGEKHLLDSLLSLGVDVKLLFAPEHGIRGDHADGTVVNSGIDEKTKIKIVSLYGSNKKPSKEIMSQLDVILFDIQDVGVRFYTYISTMHYMMQACADFDKTFIVLDRPNPNGKLIDGPILKTEFRSFIGMHPIPVAHGLTVGELAKMINGEQWLNDEKKCQLKIIACQNYDHHLSYQLPVRPSPNLPTQESVILYPHLGLFEGTTLSVGRGTNRPFEILGAPHVKYSKISFIPEKIPGVSDFPPHENEKCYGLNVVDVWKSNPQDFDQLNIDLFIDIYHHADKSKFFRADFMDKLMGTSEFRKDIMAGKSAQEIRDTWKKDLANYKKMRFNYLIYD